MRISTSMIYDSNVKSMQNQTSSLIHTQQQLAAGKRVLTPSDDPVAAAQALDVTQAQTINAQFATNQKAARSSLSLVDGQLGSVDDLLQSIRLKTLNAGTATLNDSDRKSIASALRGDFDQLKGLANATDGNGQYLFSGAQGDTIPFSGTVGAAGSSSSTVQYFGDDGLRAIQVSASRQMPVSDTGAEIFMRVPTGNGFFTVTPSVGTLSSLSSNSVTNATQLTGDNYSITFPSSVPFSVTPGGSNTSSLTARSVTSAAALTGDSYSITFPAAGQYSIQDTTTGAPAVTGTYTAGSPITAIPGMSLTINGTPGATDSYNIAAQAPVQEYQVTDTTTGSSSFHTYTSGNAITAIPGMSLTISGTPGSNDSYAIADAKPQSVFDTLSNLINALEVPTSTGGSSALTIQISAALTNLDNAQQTALQARTRIGARLSELDTLGNINSTMDTQYAQTLSNLQDVDYASAISRLSQENVGLQAAQKTYVQVTALSLFNYIN